MISDMAPAASSVVRSSRRRSFSISVENIACPAANSAFIALVQPVLEKIAQNPSSLAGHDRLWMELDAVNGQCAMAESHDDSFLACPGGDLELAGQVLFGDNERVVPRRLKRRGQAAEHPSSIMFNR